MDPKRRVTEPGYQQNQGTDAEQSGIHAAPHIDADTGLSAPDPSSDTNTDTGWSGPNRDLHSDIGTGQSGPNAALHTNTVHDTSFSDDNAPARTLAFHSDLWQQLRAACLLPLDMQLLPTDM